MPRYLTVECDIADGTDEWAWGGWLIGNLDDWMNGTFLQEEWVQLGRWALDTELTWSDGAYHATFWIPPFLPEDLTITFLAVIEFDDMEEMRAALLAMLVVMPMVRSLKKG